MESTINIKVYQFKKLFEVVTHNLRILINLTRYLTPDIAFFNLHTCFWLKCVEKWTSVLCEIEFVFFYIQGVPFKTSNIFRIDRTRLGDQGFPMQILFIQFYYILKDDFNK